MALSRVFVVAALVLLLLILRVDGAPRYLSRQGLDASNCTPPMVGPLLPCRTIGYVASIAFMDGSTDETWYIGSGTFEEGTRPAVIELPPPPATGRTVTLSGAGVEETFIVFGGDRASSGYFDVSGGSSVIMEDLSIVNGTNNNGDGGCVVVADSITLSNVAFIGCESTTGHGGGLSVKTPSFTGNGLTFVDSTALLSGGGMHVDTSSEVPASLTGVNASGCSSGTNGGSMSILSGTIVGDNWEFSDSNAGGDGGALYVNTGSTTVTDLSVYDSSAQGDGGGVYAWASVIGFEELVAQACTANGAGGGLYIETSEIDSLGSLDVSKCSADVSGGGIFLHDASVGDVGLSRLSANTAPEGAGMTMTATASMTVSLSRTSNIFSNNGQGIFHGPDVSMIIAGSIDVLISDNSDGGYVVSENFGSATITVDEAAIVRIGNNGNVNVICNSLDNCQDCSLCTAGTCATPWGAPGNASPDVGSCTCLAQSEPETGANDCACLDGTTLQPTELSCDGTPTPDGASTPWIPIVSGVVAVGLLGALAAFRSRTSADSDDSSSVDKVTKVGRGNGKGKGKGFDSGRVTSFSTDNSAVSRPGNSRTRQGSKTSSLKKKRSRGSSAAAGSGGRNEKPRKGSAQTLQTTKVRDMVSVSSTAVSIGSEQAPFFDDIGSTNTWSR